MANQILIKRSSVPAKVPTISDMAIGEIAVNTYDGKMYLRINNGVDSVVPIGGASALSQLTDVTLTSPISGQVLTYDGTEWINNATTPSAYSIVVSSWTLVSGNTYYADVTHNLGTQNVVVSLFNNTTNALVQADKVVLTSSNVARITVAGNSIPIRVVIIANGLTVLGNSQVTSVAGRTGDIVLSASDISGLPPLRTLGYSATSLDSPNNTDWVVNALAPTATDTLNPAIATRRFSNTTEQGVGGFIQVPSGATNITIAYRGRTQTAPASAANLQMRMYLRNIPNNAAVGSWSSANNLTTVVVPTNAFFQSYSYTASIASLSLVTGNSYMFEFTRNVGVAGNLAYNWLMSELTFSFT